MPHLVQGRFGEGLTPLSVCPPRVGKEKQPDRVRRLCPPDASPLSPRVTSPKPSLMPRLGTNIYSAQIKTTGAPLEHMDTGHPSENHLRDEPFWAARDTKLTVSSAPAAREETDPENLCICYVFHVESAWWHHYSSLLTASSHTYFSTFKSFYKYAMVAVCYLLVSECPPGFRDKVVISGIPRGQNRLVLKISRRAPLVWFAFRG